MVILSENNLFAGNRGKKWRLPAVRIADVRLSGETRCGPNSPPDKRRLGEGVTLLYVIILN